MKYKEYEKVFVKIDIPTIQPQLVESTQGTNMTPRATKTPTLAAEVAQKKCKSKAVARESSIPRKSFIVTIKKKKPSTTPISDDIERNAITEATLLSLTMHKTTLVAEAQENIAIVQEKILEEDIKKMVDGEDEESYASAFAYSAFQDDEDTNNRIEPKSHKEIQKILTMMMILRRKTRMMKTIMMMRIFLKIVGYEGIVNKVSAFFIKNLAQLWQTMFKKKDLIQYLCFTKLIIADLMKKFPSIA
nr:hypothetical protein [Tanacetum cinerariifolium]